MVSTAQINKFIEKNDLWNNFDKMYSFNQLKLLMSEYLEENNFEVVSHIAKNLEGKEATYFFYDKEEGNLTDIFPINNDYCLFKYFGDELAELGLSPADVIDYSQNKYFTTVGQYVRHESWYYDDCHCNIYNATEEDLANDGFNFVGKGGNEGTYIDVYNSLEEAIYNSHWKVSAWDKIGYGLSNEDMQKANKFIELAQNSKEYIYIQKEYGKMYDETSNLDNLYYSKQSNVYIHTLPNKNNDEIALHFYDSNGDKFADGIYDLRDFNSVEEIVSFSLDELDLEHDNEYMLINDLHSLRYESISEIVLTSQKEFEEERINNDNEER